MQLRKPLTSRSLDASEEASSEPGIDVLVLASSGIGHYHPIAAFVAQIADPERVAFAAMVTDTSPMRAKIDRDGFRFVRWDAVVAGGVGARALQVVRRSLVRRVVPRLARQGRPDDPMPGLAARTTFALASLLRPINEARRATGDAIDAMLTTVRPKLVLSEGYDEWLGVLCERHGISWARYTTGPVWALAKDRPTEPAGFDPALTGAEGRANRLLFTLRRRRERIARRRVLRHARRGGAAVRTADPVVRFAFSSASLDQLTPVPTGWSYVGLSPYRAPEGWEGPCDGGRDTVLVTWGSGRVGAERDLFGQLLPLLVQLAGTYRVVVRSNDDVLRDEIVGAFPAGADIDVGRHQPDPPYDEYARAALVISHGGWGTINEAVAFGAPVLVLPELVADRMETARRVDHARVGGCINRYAVTPSSLHAAVADVLADLAIAETVEAVGADLRDRQAATEVVNTLRSLLGEFPS